MINVNEAHLRKAMQQLVFSIPLHVVTCLTCCGLGAMLDVVLQYMQQTCIM